MEKLNTKLIVKAQVILSVVAAVLSLIILFTPCIKATVKPLSSESSHRLERYIQVGYEKRLQTEGADSTEALKKEYENVKEKIYNAEEVVKDGKEDSLDPTCKGYEVAVSPIQMVIRIPNIIKALIIQGKISICENEDNSVSVKADAWQKVLEADFKELSPELVDSLYLISSMTDVSAAGTDQQIKSLVNMMLFFALMITSVGFVIAFVISIIKGLVNFKKFEEYYPKAMKATGTVFSCFLFMFCITAVVPGASFAFGAIMLTLISVIVAGVNAACVYLKPFNANQKKYAMFHQIFTAAAVVVGIISITIAAGGNAMEYFTTQECYSEIAKNMTSATDALKTLMYFQVFFIVLSVMAPMVLSGFISNFCITKGEVSPTRSYISMFVTSLLFGAIPFIAKIMLKCSLPSPYSTTAIISIVMALVFLAVFIAKNVVMKKSVELSEDERKELFSGIPAKQEEVTINDVIASEGQ